MMNDSTFRLTIDTAIPAKFPGYGCLVLYANNLKNDTTSIPGLERLRAAEVIVRERFSLLPPSGHPHISAWRNAYQTFGAKPKRHLNAVEALTSRILGSGELPDINPTVNAYNRVSLLHVLPIGGEDRDQLRSDLSLHFALGDEPFVTSRSGDAVVDQPDRGEVIWADSEGVTCRRWNWRQCHRTAITQRTTRAYFVFDVLPPFDLDCAHAAAQDLIEELSIFSPHLEPEITVLQRPVS